MRMYAALVAAFAVFALLPAPLHADDGPEQPLVQIPEFGVADFAPGADERPKGWSPVTESGVIPASAPSVKGMLALAEAAKIDAKKIDARCFPLKKGEEDAAVAAVVALVAVDAAPDAFTQKLADAAVAGGWHVKEMGSPMRVAVIWTSKDAAAEELKKWQIEVAVTKLCTLAFARVLAAGQAQDRDRFQRAITLLDSAGRIEPEAGIYHVLKGRTVHVPQTERAMEHFRKALKDGAPVPPPPKWGVIAVFELGQMLLLRNSKDVEEEALAVLKKGVGWEEAARSPFMRFGNRYNLACAHARLGQIDDAFKQLEESLRFLKTRWEEEKKGVLGMSQLNYPQHYSHAKDVDPDMDALRKDERFEKLMKKYDPEPPAASPDEKKDPEKKAPEKKDPEKDGGG